MLDLDLDLDLTGGSAAAAPILASTVTIDFGALDRINSDLATDQNGGIANGGGAIASITLGTRTVGSDHFEASGIGIRPTAVPVDALYTWTGCTATGSTGLVSNTFQINIAPDANTYGYISEVELDAAINDAPGTGGVTITGRDVNMGQVAQSVIQLHAFTGEVIITARNDKRTVFEGPIFVDRSDNITLRNLDVPRTGNTDNGFSVIDSDDLIIDGCRSLDTGYTDFETDPANKSTCVAFDTDNVNVQITDCEFGNAYRGLIGGAQGTVLVERNYIHDTFEDAGQFTHKGSQTLFRYADNLIASPRSLDEIVHVDALQFNMRGVSETEDWVNVEVTGNLFADFLSTSQSQGPFSDGGNTFFIVLTARGNIVVFAATNGINIGQARDNTAEGNTNITVDGHASPQTPSINMGSGTKAGTQVSRFNISDAISNPSASDNTICGAQGATIAYTSIFTGVLSGLDTFDKVITAYADITGSPDSADPKHGANDTYNLFHGSLADLGSNTHDFSAYNTAATRTAFTPVESTTAASSFTFGTVSVGTAVADGKLSLVITTRNTSQATTISSVTVDSNNATSRIAAAATDSFLTRTEIWDIADPRTASSTDTVSIVVTFNESTLACGVTPFLIEGAATGAPADTGTSVASPGSSSMTWSAGAVLVCGTAAGISSVSAVAWTGGNLAEDYDQAIITNSYHWSGASSEESTGDTATLTATYTGGSPSDVASVFVAYDPA